MKKLLFLILLVSSLVFHAHAAQANAHEGQVSTQIPYVTVNIGVEISGLGTAAEDAATGLNLIGESLQNLADDPELTEEQHEQINLTLRRIDKLGQSLALAVESMPGTVKKSMVPVVDATHELSSQIKRIVVTTAISLVLIILAAFAAVYYFVLAPGTQSVVKTARLLDELATALKTTAEIVEISSERNSQVMEEIRAVREERK